MLKRRGAAINNPVSVANSGHGAWKNIWRQSRCSSIWTKRRSAGTDKFLAGRNTHMGTIQIRTAIPGTKSKALMDRRKPAAGRGPCDLTPVIVAEAEGAVLED